MGPAPISERKLKVAEELQKIYSENSSKSLKALEELLGVEKLSEESQKYINGSDEVKEYYEKVKEDKLQKHRYYITIQFQSMLDKLKTEEEKKQRANMFINVALDKLKDEKEKQRLEYIINQKTEENKMHLQHIKNLNQEEIEKLKEQNNEIMKEYQKAKLDIFNHKKSVEDAYKEMEKLKEETEKKFRY